MIQSSFKIYTKPLYLHQVQTACVCALSELCFVGGDKCVPSSDKLILLLESSLQLIEALEVSSHCNEESTF